MAPPSPRHPGRSLLALVLGAGTAISFGLTAEPAPARTAASGAKGAQVYCFMRSNGNSHEVSWTAAYALIKRENAGLFKTSPEHAAVLITETVVQNPSAYPDCPRYLGDLYRSKVPVSAAKVESVPVEGRDVPAPVPMTRSERYGY